MQRAILGIVGVVVCSFLNIALQIVLWYFLLYVENAKRFSELFPMMIVVAIMLGTFLGTVIGLIIGATKLNWWQGALVGFGIHLFIIFILASMTSSGASYNSEEQRNLAFAKMASLPVFYLIIGAVCGLLTALMTNFISKRFFDKSA